MCNRSETSTHGIFFCCPHAPTPCPPPPSYSPPGLSLSLSSAVSPAWLHLLTPEHRHSVVQLFWCRCHAWTTSPTSLLSGRLLFPPPRLLLSHASHHLEGTVVPPTDNWMLLQEQMVFLSSVYFLICCPSKGSFRNFLDWPLEVWDLTSDLFLQVFQDKQEAYSHERIWLNFWSENWFETSRSFESKPAFITNFVLFFCFFSTDMTFLSFSWIFFFFWTIFCLLIYLFI